MTGWCHADHSLLKTFATTDHDGSQPYNSMLLDGDGVLYGTTFTGGINNGGTVFRVNVDGSSFTNLHRFTATNSADRSGPQCQLIKGDDGRFYGATLLMAGVTMTIPQ